MSFEQARQVADAVLYEGYLLYPYRASAAKNQVRWQFGVLVPRACAEASGAEPWRAQTECLVEPKDDCVVQLQVRCLQVQARRVEEVVDAAGAAFRPVVALEVDGAPLLTWDEGVERTVDAALPLVALLGGEQAIPFELPGGEEVESVQEASGAPRGRIVRQCWPVAGVLRASAERLEGPYGVVRLRVGVENITPWQERAAERDAVLRRSLIATHTLLGVGGGAFLSLLDPPEWARPAAANCVNEHTWPVLVGEAGARDVLLSSPIILYDYPAIAPESPGDMFDATEIDEILTLRTMTLTEAEKREARATDPRAAAIIDRADNLPPELLDRLHGAVRYLRAATEPPTITPPEVPWWDPGADASVSPETDSVLVGDVPVQKGSRVRLRPGSRRTDAQDMFLVGRTARVEAVFLDVDGNQYLAVTPEDDPAADLQQWYGRFLYFYPDEVEPLEASA